MPSETFMSEKGVFYFFLCSQVNKQVPKGAPFFLGLSITEQKGWISESNVKCQDTVPAAVNVLAYSIHQMTVWVKPRCQALTISKETNNNKRAQEWTRDISVRQKKKNLSFSGLSTSTVTSLCHLYF